MSKVLGAEAVTGIDINEKALAELGRRLPGVTRVHGRARQLPFEDGQFELVYTVGVLIHRNDNLIYANRAFLEWTGFADLAAVANAGGLERLVVEPGSGALDRANGTGKTFTIATRAGDTLTCEGRLYSVPWKAESALMLVLIRTAADERHKASELAWHAAEAWAQLDSGIQCYVATGGGRRINFEQRAIDLG